MSYAKRITVRREGRGEEKEGSEGEERRELSLTKTTTDIQGTEKRTSLVQDPPCTPNPSRARPGRLPS